jgi:hypothetical protein
MQLNVLSYVSPLSESLKRDIHYSIPRDMNEKKTTPRFWAKYYLPRILEGIFRN